jgi:2-hydroxychromene-2-carboxylate isomerase
MMPGGRIFKPVNGSALPHEYLARRQCEATSKQSGQRCQRRPIPGGTVCVMHGGAAPQVRFAVALRLLTSQDRAILRLAELMRQREYPSTALSAAKYILDRTMGKPTEKVDPTMKADESEVVARIHEGRARLVEYAAAKLLTA